MDILVMGDEDNILYSYFMSVSSIVHEITVLLPNPFDEILSSVY